MAKVAYVWKLVTDKEFVFRSQKKRLTDLLLSSRAAQDLHQIIWIAMDDTLLTRQFAQQQNLTIESDLLEEKVCLRKKLKPSPFPLTLKRLDRRFTQHIQVLFPGISKPALPLR